MALSLDGLIEAWDGVGVVVRYDRETGTWMFIAIHNNSSGMPSGGTRMKVYPTPAHGLRDAMRLAQGMTFKWAAIDFEYGGGKAVLAVPRVLQGAEREGLLRRYGRLLTSLKGAFGTGVDLGTTAEDMLVIAEETDYVHGVDRVKRESVDPGPFTAIGVFSGIQAAAKHVLGVDSLEGVVVHVQGVGGVGAPLARMLKGVNARIQLSDLNAARVQSLAAELGDAETFESDAAYDAQCDVFAPCAVGSVLNRETIPRLKCRIIAGSANNQLEEATDAQRLEERGIVYAPDYIVNAGGAIALAMLGKGASQGEIEDRVGRIGDSLSEILERASAAGESPIQATTRVVEQKLGLRSS